MLTDFQNSFTVRLISKFAIKSSLNISPHHKFFATLPCEILMTENSLKRVDNDKSQGSVATHLMLVSYSVIVLTQSDHSVCWWKT